MTNKSTNEELSAEEILKAARKLTEADETIYLERLIEQAEEKGYQRGLKHGRDIRTDQQSEYKLGKIHAREEVKEWIESRKEKGYEASTIIKDLLSIISFKKI